jgi:Second Messenger Oligonucleotide or Dinucleotide Synthetase domain
MSTATSPFLIETFETQLDDLLFGICVELQLDEARYQLADSHYQAVNRWLEAPGSVIARYKPLVYPQGSMRLNTTVQPLEGDEYDLDFVCEFTCDANAFRNPGEALSLLARRLEQHDVYRARMEVKNRCVRLNYEHEFHMDILPACRDVVAGGTCLMVPDREAQCWKPSNPKGYASWFEDRASVRGTPRGILAKADPIPDQEAAEEKSPLKLDVQLLKRWRDVRYRSNCELAPISIVLTTLAAGFYRGETSISAALGNSLDGISRAVSVAWPRLIVPNPSNLKEDLSERWDSDPNAYRAFVHGITEFNAQWTELRSARGIQRVAGRLERLFGERVARKVIEKQARDVEAARARNDLGASRATGALTGIAANSVPVHRNTFYGEK